MKRDVPVSAATGDAAKPTNRRWFALAVLMLPVLLVSIDNTVLSFALPLISLEFNTAGTTLLWIVDSYPLVLAGLLVPMGSLGDRYGRRLLLLIGGTGFAALSVIAAYSPSAEILVVARIGLGFFGAMLMPATLSLLRNIFTDRNERRIALATWASGFAAGSALGPIVGGVLLENYHWGSVFLIAVPLLLPMLMFTPMLVPESKDPSPGPIDIVSIILVMSALTPLVYGIKQLASHGFSLDLIFWFALAIFAGIAFTIRQLRSSHPMLDMRLFAQAPFTGSILINLLSIFSLTGFVYFGSQHLQLVLGVGPLQSGLYLLPGVLIMIVTSFVVVELAKHIAARYLVFAAMLLAAAGYLFTALLGNGASAAILAIAFTLLSAGVGIGETLSNDIIVATVPANKAGAASAISETAYELGTVLGTAVLGSILIHSYKQTIVLPDTLSAQQVAKATETLGGAVNVAGELPASSSATLLESAFRAFDSGVVLTSGIATVLMLLASVFALITLRGAK